MHSYHSETSEVGRRMFVAAVLFPAFRKLVSKQEYGALGEDFEKTEHELVGEGGFDKMVDRVAAIEKRLGIYDLSQFTPKE